MSAGAPPPQTAWAPAAVTADHLRALTAVSSDPGRDRSALIADRAGRLTVTTPDQAAARFPAGTDRLVATHAHLLDAGLRISWTAGRLIGPVAEVCAREAAAPAAAERELAPQ